MNAPSDETDVVQRLFQEHVPEVASGEVEIVGIARDRGNRCVLAVTSKKPVIDAVGACVGNRGDRVRQVVAALGGEHVDIVLWSESAERFIANLLAPLRLARITFEETSHQARVVLAQNSDRPPANRLVLQSKLLLQLTGWDLRVESGNVR
jgi:transcription termination/antitermination protein NusA